MTSTAPEGRRPRRAGRAGTPLRAGARVGATTASTEDYLEGIYDLTGSGGPVIGARLARHLKVSPPAVTEALQRLARAGYLRVEAGKHIVLTRRGKTLAEMMARRHRLLERWLTDVLGLDWIEAHEEAHRLEHALSPRVEDRLATILGMPSTCPHGNPIPGMAGPRAVRPFPLDQALEGDTVVVERITEEAEADKKLLEYLWRNGVRPGTRLQIQEVAPWAGTITTTSDGRTIVLGVAAAGKIWVYAPQPLTGPAQTTPSRRSAAISAAP
jgi:DtxR family transcriptional regulator, Mn-dependent transcriptional regulator